MRTNATIYRINIFQTKTSLVKHCVPEKSLGFQFPCSIRHTDTISNFLFNISDVGFDLKSLKVRKLYLWKTMENLKNSTNWKWISVLLNFGILEHRNSINWNRISEFLNFGILDHWNSTNWYRIFEFMNFGTLKFYKLK